MIFFELFRTNIVRDWSRGGGGGKRSKKYTETNVPMFQGQGHNQCLLETLRPVRFETESTKKGIATTIIESEIRLCDKWELASAERKIKT